MARVKKIDNAVKKRFERTEKKRATNTRNERVYYLIVCEGEKTEPNYFNELKKELPPNTIEIEIEGTGRNTIGIVEHAIKKRDKTSRKHDRVWVVFDKDDFPDDNFNGAINKADSNKISCAWTNEAFELWFLLHFQLVSNAMSRDDYKNYLEREIQKKAGNANYKYEKNQANTYSLLKLHGNQKQAIKWAKELLNHFSCKKYATHNPCTKVHELIEELFNPQEVLRKINESTDSD